MRLAELQYLGSAWRVWAVFDADALPESDTSVVRYVPVTGADPATYATYDAQTGTFASDGWTPPATPATPAGTRMSRLAFQSRYTLDEQVAIEMAASGAVPSVPQQARATLRVLERALQSATEIDLTDPRTVQGVGLHAQLGFLTPARAAQILDPNWSPA